MAEKTENKRVTGFRPPIEERVRLAAARLPAHDGGDYTSAEFNTEKPRACPKCGGRLSPNETTCSFCHEERKRKQTKTGATVGWVITAIIGAVVIAFTVTRLPRKQVAAAPAIPPDGTWLPQPDATANLAKSLDNLKVGSFYVMRDRGSDFVVVSGDVKNISDHVHVDVMARVELLDLNGKTVATVDDYIKKISGRGTWHIVARTNAPKAVNARFVKLVEKL